MKVDKNVCVGCGACTGVCPVGAITLKNGVAVRMAILKLLYQGGTI